MKANLDAGMDQLALKNSYHPIRSTNNDRINFAIEHFGTKSFSRKDYLSLNKGISTATASRDLSNAVKDKKIKMLGDKALTVYRVNRK